MTVLIGRDAELWTGSGAGTAMTKEACEAVGVSTVRFHVTNATKRYLNPNVSILVYDNDVLQTTGYHIETIHVVFDVAPSGPVTLTGNYLTPAKLTYCQNWSLAFNTDVYDITSIGDTAKVFMGSGLLSWSGSFERIADDGDKWGDIATDNTTRLLGRFFLDKSASKCWTGWLSPNNWSLNLPLDLARESFGFDGVGKPCYTVDET